MATPTNDSNTQHPLVIAVLLGIIFTVLFVGISEGGDGNPIPTTTSTTSEVTTTTESNTTTTIATTTTMPAGNALDVLDNIANMPAWFDPGITQDDLINDSTYANLKYKSFHNPIYTEQANPLDAGSNSQGQFRIICAPSHFAYDDPIIFPNEQGRSHLHMFFGNSNVDAFTTDFNTLLNNGGSTCQSGILNRSSYWMPALLAGGKDENRKIVPPHVITLYYKSYKPDQVNVFKQGTQLLSGNVDPTTGMASKNDFRVSERLHWGCYNPSLGLAVNLTNTIPGTDSDGDGIANTKECPNGWDIQATIQFPQCMAVDENREPILTSPNHQDHSHMLFNVAGNYGDQNKPCPTSHPYRVPQITYLVRWSNPVGLGEANWRLSSDVGADNQLVAKPGMTLHADWFSAWNDDAQRAWIDGCFKSPAGSRNCSLGQTGQNNTGLKFRPITGTQLNNMFYTGPQLVDDPSS